MQLVLDSKELKIERHRNLFRIESPDGTKRGISPRKVTSIAVTQSVWLSAGAVQLAAEHEIPILFFDPMGRATARLSSPYFSSIATLRRAQVRFAELPSATRWMAGLYLIKVEAQMENLERLRADPAAIAAMRVQLVKLEGLTEGPLSETGPHLMAAEAVAARRYWPALGAVLPGEGSFDKRSRMPAQDPFNAALNYLYGMMYSVVESGLFAAGLDPHLGLLHADEYNKPVLAFDFIEPFRPWVDWLVAEQFMQNKVTADFFKKTANGVLLDKPGKAFFIPLFNEWLRTERLWGGKNRTAKNHIYQLAGRFANKLRRELCQP